MGREICEDCPQATACTIAEEKLQSQQEGSFHRKTDHYQAAIGALALAKEIHIRAVERIGCEGYVLASNGYYTCPLEGTMKDFYSYLQGPNVNQRGEWNVGIFSDIEKSGDDEARGQYL